MLIGAKTMKTIKVKDFCIHCMSREKGRQLYQELAGSSSTEFNFDFSGVEYVSSSFLDETVWKLAEENFKITVFDPDKVIEPKLHKINRWTGSNIHIIRKDRFLELAT